MDDVMLAELDDKLAILTLQAEEEVAILALKLQTAIKKTYGENFFEINEL